MKLNLIKRSIFFQDFLDTVIFFALSTQNRLLLGPGDLKVKVGLQVKAADGQPAGGAVIGKVKGRVAIDLDRDDSGGRQADHVDGGDEGGGHVRVAVGLNGAGQPAVGGTSGSGVGGAEVLVVVHWVSRDAVVHEQLALRRAVVVQGHQELSAKYYTVNL